MKKLLIFMFFTIQFLYILAQGNGEIKGRILEPNGKTGLVGANVVIKQGNVFIGAQSDKNGYYTLKPIPSGTYNVYFTYMGFDSVIVTQVVVAPEKAAYIQNIKMKEKTTLLDDTEIIGKGGRKLIDPEDPGKMTVIAREIEEMPDSRNLAKVITSFSSEITSTNDGELYFRGSRKGDFVYIIDGVNAGDKVKVPGGSIGSMTIYTGGVPAKYGDFTGGCVVIETKSYFDIASQKREMELVRAAKEKQSKLVNEE